MMDYPLLVHQFLERANTFTPNKEIVTREGEGTHRYTYADLMLRTSRLSNALSGLGVGVGDRVGTFAWNTYRHLEAYFAAPVMGAVLHTTNIRLAAEDYDETSADDIPKRERRSGGTLVTLAAFGLGIFLVIALLYFAY